jgi:hypothetical protein
MKNLVLSWDADNAGRHIGQSILDNNLHSLAHYSKAIKDGNEMIVEWAQSHGGEVISDGGDQGVVVFSESSDIEAILSELEHVRAEYQNLVGNTVTFGIGSDLSESGKALIAGKLMGKDIIVPYDEHVEEVLSEAHQHAQEGHATEDELKEDEHYINHLMGDEESSDEEFSDEEYNEDQDSDENYPGEFEIEDDSLNNEDKAQDQIEAAIKDPEIEEDDENVADEDGYNLGEGDVEDDSSRSRFMHHDVADENNNNLGEGDEEKELSRLGFMLHHVPGTGEEGNEKEGEEEENEMSMPMQDDGMQEGMQGMSEEMPMQDGDLGQDQKEDQPDFQEEEPINIDLPKETKKDEESGQSDDHDDAESEAMMQLATEDSQLDAIKDKVAQILQAFKSKKETLEQLKQADPEAYQAMIEMLRAMIEMANLMTPMSPQDDTPSPAMEEQAAQDQVGKSIPKM